ncbi:restriction endonuclease subunit S [Paracoccus sp. NSM]|uniref:restriction endonuclease subunit S n=1 Tax=Paracoccus sp. NSM TaxID=3457784 RepID=UPI00403596E3
MIAIKHFVEGFFDGPHATPKEADDGPIFLGIKNITDDGRLDLSEIKHISEDEFPRWTRRVVPQKDDIVFTYEATLHRYAIIPDGFRGCLGRRMALIRPDTTKVAPKFLHYYCLSTAWRNQAEGSKISGATVDRIPLTKVPDFQVQFPDLPTQHRIAGILSAYDDLIENNRRRIGLLEQAARLLYREWFVHLRFPGHETAEIVNGLPDGWERMPASEAMHINPRTTWKASESKLITMVPMGALSTSGMNCDPSLFERREQPAGVKFMNGDTLFARITPCLENGKTGYVNFLQDGEVACGSTEFVVFRERRISRFMAYLLAREEGFRKNAITSMVGSSGRQRVQPSCFDKYLLPVPPKPVIEDFDRVVEPMFREIEHIDKAIGKLTRARDLLLPRLMDGRIPV